MKRVGVAELKSRLSEYLRAARRGTEITVLDRGEPIAMIVAVGRGGALVVREPGPRAGRLGEMRPGSHTKLSVDPVQLLLEDRQSE